jgi:hypothetical protein
VLGAAAGGDHIVTSDPQDIDRLVTAIGGNISVLAVRAPGFVAVTCRRFDRAHGAG